MGWADTDSDFFQFFPHRDSVQRNAHSEPDEKKIDDPSGIKKRVKTQMSSRSEISDTPPLNWREKMPSNWTSSSEPVKKLDGDVKTAPTLFSGTTRMEGRQPMTLMLRTNFTKTERFDEDIIQQMLMDDTITMSDRKRLSNYFRARNAPSKNAIIYERSKNLQDLQLGRFYPVGVGLQSFRWDIRSPLIAKWYWDVDMENCHYNIALKYAREFGVASTAIQRYCDNRDECLALVSDNRGSAKTAFLKVLYGGDLGLYRENAEDNSGACKPEGDAFLRLLKAECDVLAEVIWGRNVIYHKVKCGKENKPMDKRPNKHFVLMSLLFQTEEAKCLMALDQFFTSIQRTVGILIHDGATIEKEEGELEFPAPLLKEGSDAIFQMTGYRFRLTVKPIKNTYVAPQSSPNEYATMKRDFEKNNFLVGATLHCITSDGVREQFEWSKANQTKFADLQITILDEKTMKTVKKPFLPEWIKDKERRSYERIDFIPTHKPCPDYIYNLFTGFAVEEEQRAEMFENGYIDEKEEVELIAPLLLHADVLCGDGNRDYFIKWLAQLFQHPEVKSNVGLLFRDMGSLLRAGGGTGKNVFMDFIGSLLGDKYYLTVSDNSTLYADFNSLFEGKLLIFIEEADGKDNHKNNDKLKSRMTAKKTSINKKGQAQYVVSEHARFLGATNGRNPIPTRDGQTRWGFFDVATTYRGNKEYFNTLVKATTDRRVRVAFYQYLMRHPTWTTPIEFSTNVPITPAFVDVCQMNAPPILKWLCLELRDGTLPTRATTKELYGRFTQWYELGNRDRAFMLPNENIFGRMMKEAFISEDEPSLGALALTQHRHCERGTEHRFNFPLLMEGLENRYLLNKGDCRLDEDGCLIQFDDAEPQCVQRK